MGELGNRKDTEEAERKEHGSERQVHEFRNIVDNLVEPVWELFAAHKRHSENKAYSRRQDSVTGEDDSHADLGLVAFLVNFGLTGQVDHVLLLDDLLHDERVSDHD